MYYAPSADTIQAYRDYVESLPFNDEPEIFGMHENANIAFQVRLFCPSCGTVTTNFILFILLPFVAQTQETHTLVNTVLDVQPRLAGSSGGKTSDEIVFELAGNILNKIPDKLDLDKAIPELFEVCSFIVALRPFVQARQPY